MSFAVSTIRPSSSASFTTFASFFSVQSNAQHHAQTADTPLTCGKAMQLFLQISGLFSALPPGTHRLCASALLQLRHMPQGSRRTSFRDLPASARRSIFSHEIRTADRQTAADALCKGYDVRSFTPKYSYANSFPRTSDTRLHFVYDEHHDHARGRALPPPLQMPHPDPVRRLRPAPFPSLWRMYVIV